MPKYGAESPTLSILGTESIINFVIVPADQLSDSALNSLIESFVLREGTDYGNQEISLEKKIEQVRSQIFNNKVQIAFDPETQSINLLSERDYLASR
jgi:uncharacterized protein